MKKNIFSSSKKLFLVTLIVAIAGICELSAQVLQNTGVKNTMWIGFGKPFSNPSASEDEDQDLSFYGLHETIQARVNVGKFGIEGMLNWVMGDSFSAQNFSILNNSYTPYYYTNYIGSGGDHTTATTSSYYVNFLFNPVKGLDLGMGTRLAWVIGPAPACLGYFWEENTHTIQGGLKEAVPGGADVAGYTYYPNIYSAAYNTTSSIGARYRYNDLLEVGLTVPSVNAGNEPFVNLAFAIQPVDLIRIAFAYEGIFYDLGYLYTGLSFYLDSITIDAYFSGNEIFNEDTYGNYGFGAAVQFKIPKTTIVLRPELGLTWYENKDYNLATYIGARLDAGINDNIKLGLWTSIAFGSSNKYWYEDDTLERLEHGIILPYETTKDWTGGTVFDIRPDVTFEINRHHSISLAFDFQTRTSYLNETKNAWSGGLYYTYTTF